MDRGETNNEPVVILSYAVWQEHFAGDRSLVGKSIWLDQKPYTVAAVGPKNFRGLGRLLPADAWVPVSAKNPGTEISQRNFRDFELLGRLRPNATAQQAEAEIETIGQRLAQAYPANDKSQTLTLISEARRLRKAFRPALFLMSMVGFVLLIACANVAGLLVARAEARCGEFAIRRALGAGRFRLVRQLVTESVLLALTSAAFGLALTWRFIGLQAAFMPLPTLPFRLDMRAGGATLFFAVLVALLTTILSGLIPAFGISKPDLVSALKGAFRPERRPRLPVRNVLVVAQIALSVVLLAATGLLLRSLLFSLRIPSGFDPDKRLVLVDLAPGASGYSTQQSIALFHQLAERVRALPGVRQVSFARRAPLSLSGGGVSRKVSIPGVEIAPGLQSIDIKFNAVGANYFRVVGTGVLEGRDFSQTDELSDRLVVLIDETMAHLFWPESDPVGKHVRVDGKDCEIIGVTEGVKINGIHEPPEPYMFFPFTRASGNEGTLIVETISDPRIMIPTIRKTVHDTDGNVPIVEMLTLAQLMHFALWQDRMKAELAGMLGVIGMFLAAIGLYGVIAYLVHRRNHEIGVRLALGARKRDILALVIGHGLKLAMAGVTLGLIAALTVTRLMSSVLFGVKPTDLMTFGATAFAVVAIAIAATCVPAVQAVRLDPVVALRNE